MRDCSAMTLDLGENGLSSKMLLAEAATSPQASASSSCDTKLAALLATAATADCTDSSGAAVHNERLVLLL